MYRATDLWYNFKRTPKMIAPEVVLREFGEKIASGTPFFAGRMGMNEIASCRMASFGYRDRYEETLEILCNNAGFFPKDESLLPQFLEVNAHALSQVDYLHPMEAKGENYLIHRYCRDDVQFIHNLGCWDDAEYTWSRHLAGKKVLVIHPFANTIRQQYARRTEIFPEIPHMLPEFELQTLQAVQTIAGVTDSRFANWFEALEYMKEEVDRREYDIALIGCGAYGFPLAAHVKESGHIAIHMGGDLQILFGILGKRWESHPGMDRIVNDAWVRPAVEDIPSGSESVEDGCYW